MLSYGIIGTLVFALAIVAIYSVLTSGLSTGKKVLWIVIILILPLVGSILWFLIGRST